MTPMFFLMRLTAWSSICHRWSIGLALLHVGHKKKSELSVVLYKELDCLEVYTEVIHEIRFVGRKAEIELEWSQC